MFSCMSVSKFFCFLWHDTKFIYFIYFRSCWRTLEERWELFIVTYVDLKKKKKYANVYLITVITDSQGKNSPDWRFCHQSKPINVFFSISRNLYVHPGIKSSHGAFHTHMMMKNIYDSTIVFYPSTHSLETYNIKDMYAWNALNLNHVWWFHEYCYFNIYWWAHRTHKPISK